MALTLEDEQKQKNLNISGSRPSFRTEKGVIWGYHGSKTGGANQAGELGGIYKNGNKTALFKQDPKPEKNIAEFLASRIHRSTHPGYHAEVIFAKSEEQEGQDPYIASIFFDNYQDDLYKFAYKDQGLAPPSKRPRMMGTKEKIPSHNKVPKLVNKVLNKTSGFAEAVAPRLLTNDMDMHAGNLGIVKENGYNKIVSIDYGAANSSLEDKIHPHSHIRHLPGFGPTNHFREYKRKHKITPEFANACDKIATHNYTKAIDDAFSEIKKYNTEPAIRRFGQMLGMPKEILRNTLRSKDKDQLVQDIKDYYKQKIQARQKDLGRFSAQIKTDLCVKNYQKHGIMHYQDGDKVIYFNEVVKQHKDYFKEILEGKEEFKFRDKNNANKALKKQVIDEVKINLKGLVNDAPSKMTAIEEMQFSLQKVSNKLKDLLSCLQKWLIGEIKKSTGLTYQSVPFEMQPNQWQNNNVYSPLAPEIDKVSTDNKLNYNSTYIPKSQQYTENNDIKFTTNPAYLPPEIHHNAQYSLFTTKHSIFNTSKGAARGP